MLVELRKASNWNTNKQKEKYEKLGFKFEKDDHDEKRPWYDITKSNIVEVDNPYDLVKQVGSVVISTNYYKNSDADYLIIIYDDYLE